MLDPDDPERHAYLAIHNRKDLVLARIFDPPRYQRLIADLRAAREQRALSRDIASRARLTREPD